MTEFGLNVVMAVSAFAGAAIALGSAYYARSQAKTPHNAMDAAKRSADAAERSAKADEKSAAGAAESLLRLKQGNPSTVSVELTASPRTFRVIVRNTGESSISDLSAMLVREADSAFASVPFPDTAPWAVNVLPAHHERPFEITVSDNVRPGDRLILRYTWRDFSGRDRKHDSQQRVIAPGAFPT